MFPLIRKAVLELPAGKQMN